MNKCYFDSCPLNSNFDGLNWTDEQIAISMNNDDLKEYCNWVMKVLGE